MPFTLAHPAAAIPLARALGRWGVLSALVIGSMTPDFAYFLPIGVRRSQSHSPAGLLWFCLPAGLVTYWLFHALARDALLALMPATTLREPLERPRRAPGLAPVVVSLLLGAITHVAWDAFTHAGTPIVAAMPALQTLLVDVPGFPIRVYRVLQHGSSAVGLALIALWTWRWRQRAQDHAGAPRPALTSSTRALVVAALVMAGVLGATRGALAHADIPGSVESLSRVLWHGTMSGTRASLVAILVWSVLWRYVVRQRLSERSGAVSG
jgi:hypothetical protein